MFELDVLTFFWSWTHGSLLTLSFIWFYVHVKSSQAARNYVCGRTRERLLRRMCDFANSLEASVLNDNTVLMIFAGYPLFRFIGFSTNCDGFFCVERGAFVRIRCDHTTYIFCRLSFMNWALCHVSTLAPRILV